MTTDSTTVATVVNSIPQTVRAAGIDATVSVCFYEVFWGKNKEPRIIVDAGFLVRVSVGAVSGYVSRFLSVVLRRLVERLVVVERKNHQNLSHDKIFQ